VTTAAIALAQLRSRKARVLFTIVPLMLDTLNGVLILRGTGINGLRMAHIKEA